MPLRAVNEDKKVFYTKEDEKFIKEVQSLFPFHEALYIQICTVPKRK